MNRKIALKRHRFDLDYLSIEEIQGELEHVKKLVEETEGAEGAYYETTTDSHDDYTSGYFVIYRFETEEEEDQREEKERDRLEQQYQWLASKLGYSSN